MNQWVRRISTWEKGRSPRKVAISEVSGSAGLRWFELVCGAEETDEVLRALEEHCQGLTKAMLEDLLTPDEQPEGTRYANGVRLASSFSVVAWRPEDRVERGRPQGVGVLRFQPVELLAGTDWLITCWHPQRVFQGSKPIEEEPPGGADELFEGMADRWERSSCATAGDLGIRVMHELALSYAPAHRALAAWLEDWELSLYTRAEEDEAGDGSDALDQLPELWGLMAVARNWLSPLNKPGLQADVSKAWLPASDHDAVKEVDHRVDKALAALARLSETLRQSFGLLHLEQTEEQRQRSESMQRRFELVAVAFLVPTFIVGFYGANTWVPGQGEAWGFEVMVVALVAGILIATIGIWLAHARTKALRRRELEERREMRNRLLLGSS
jgi:CorA-like Mg2+ transporter protein